MGNELYGYTNNLMAEMTSHIFNCQDFLKFVYYSQDKGEENILLKDDLSVSKVLNKNIFMYKRLDEVIEESGAYVSIDIYRLTPTSIGSPIREVTFTVDVLVHKDCQYTVHGNRAICIMTALENALADYIRRSSIGQIDLVRVSPILGVVKDFGGYQLQFRAYGFRDNLRKL